MRLHIVLHKPEIPQNTGSIGRTCVALNAKLHLIMPMGFSMDDKYLKRAGLDYWSLLKHNIHESWEDFLNRQPSNTTLWFFSTKAKKAYSDIRDFGENVFLVFGKETCGLPQDIMNSAPEHCLRIPMARKARSLNLAVSVGIAAYQVVKSSSIFIT